MKLAEVKYHLGIMAVGELSWNLSAGLQRDICFIPSLLAHLL
jgi:hypothetical protein